MNVVLFLSYLLVLLFLIYLVNRKSILGIIAARFGFKCTRCGNCCRFIVKLNKDDIKNLERVGKKDFIELRKAKKYLKRKNGYCIFLSLNKGVAKCDVYKNRPIICKNFPRFKFLGFDALDIRSKGVKIPKLFRNL